MTMLEAALAYAAMGWAVFPLQPHGKEPATKHGFLDASKDPEQIREWWTADPERNIGIATGSVSGFVVIDIDPRNGGYESWSALLKEYGSVHPQRIALTGGGGRHMLFAVPDYPLRSKLAEGIDVKGDGGYIVAPPSIHPSGDAYEWEKEGSDLTGLPTWILGRLVKPERSGVEVAVDPDDTRPGTIFNREATFDEILTPHGWAEIDGRPGYWTRPGKDSGVSATTDHGDVPGYFYVFTTSTEFEAGRGYDKVGTYAVLNFGGDVSAALADIKEKYSGPRITIDPDTLPEFTLRLSRPAYEFELPLPEDHFIQQYINYGHMQTDAALEYHEAAALMLLGLATTNLKANLAPYPGGLATNLYLGLVGATTRSRKSTAQAIATDLAEALAPYSVLPSRTTTEALVRQLAGSSGLATVWLPDEFGMLIAEIGRRDFLRGVEEVLLTVYSGKDYVYTTMKDTVRIHNPHLSVLGATTPEALALAGPTAMLGGLLPRFAIIYPGSWPEARPAVAAQEGLAAARSELLRWLRRVTQFADETRNVTFSEQATTLLNETETRLVDTGAHTARLPAMLYKVAMLVTAARLSAVVSGDDAAAAVRIVDRWREGAERLQPFLRRKAGDIEFSRMLKSALEFLKDEGGIAHRSVIARRVGTTKQRLTTIGDTLEDHGYIVIDRNAGLWRMEREWQD